MLQQIKTLSVNTQCFLLLYYKERTIFLIMDIHFNPIAFWGLLILAILLAVSFVWFTRDKWFGDSTFRFVALFLILAIIIGIMANLIFMFGLGVSYTPIFEDLQKLIHKIL